MPFQRALEQSEMQSFIENLNSCHQFHFLQWPPLCWVSTCKDFFYAPIKLWIKLYSEMRTRLSFYQFLITYRQLKYMHFFLPKFFDRKKRRSELFQHLSWEQDYQFLSFKKESAVNILMVSRKLRFLINKMQKSSNK